jgi:hypothetical protein
MGVKKTKLEEYTPEAFKAIIVPQFEAVAILTQLLESSGIQFVLVLEEVYSIFGVLMDRPTSLESSDEANIYRQCGELSGVGDDTVVQLLPELFVL